MGEKWDVLRPRVPKQTCQRFLFDAEYIRPGLRTRILKKWHSTYVQYLGCSGMVKAYIETSAGGWNKLYFNIDANVGAEAPNLPEDVQLVQLGYYAMGRNQVDANHYFPPNDLAVFKSVIPGAQYNGDPSDPLSKAIRAHQKARHERGHGPVPDGHVSAVPAGHSGTYMLPVLVAYAGLMRADLYPRFDLYPECPALLRQKVKTLLAAFLHTPL